MVGYCHSKDFEFGDALDSKDCRGFVVVAHTSVVGDYNFYRLVSVELEIVGLRPVFYMC